MKSKANYSYIGIAFIVLVFGILFIPKIVNRYNEGDIIRNNESRSNGISTQNSNKLSDLSFIEINGVAKKVPEFSFVNQYGKTISNADYSGKVYVVEFFFTTCPSICPKMNNNLIQIQDNFIKESDFGVASFTINPDYDSPNVLKAYADQYGVSNPNWHLMTGDKSKIYDLANLGFNIYAGENPEVAGGFEHSGNFALIDKKGFIRSRLDDYGNPKIFYKGIVSEKEGYGDDGQKEEISILKQDILKLLEE